MKVLLPCLRVWPVRCSVIWRRGMYEEAKAIAAKRYEGHVLERAIFSWSCRIMAFRSRQQVNHAAAADAAERLGIDLVATNDVHYTYAKDAEAHDILLCLQTGKEAFG